MWSVDLPWDFVSSAVRLHPRPPSSPALLAERSGGESLFKTRGRRGAFSSLFSSEAANYSSPVSQPASQPASNLQGIDRLDRGGRSIDRSIDRYSFSFKNVRKKPPSAMPSFGEGVRDKCCREREISWYKLEPRASEPGEKEGKDHRQH